MICLPDATFTWETKDWKKRIQSFRYFLKIAFQFLIKGKVSFSVGNPYFVDGIIPAHCSVCSSSQDLIAYEESDFSTGERSIHVICLRCDLNISNLYQNPSKDKISDILLRRGEANTSLMEILCRKENLPC